MAVFSGTIVSSFNSLLFKPFPHRGQNRMKNLSLSAVLLAAALPCLAASTPQVARTASTPLTLEASIAYVHVSGVRDIRVPDSLPTIRETSRLVAPSLRVGYTVHKDWDLGIRYAYYDEINSSAAFHTALPYEARSEERIHEAAFDLRYSFRIDDRFCIQAGPVLSAFFSHLDYWAPGSGVPIIQLDAPKSDEAAFRLGATLSLKASLSDRWTAVFEYRLAAPEEHTFNMVGAGLSCRL